MRILVTGGCGFIGSHIVDELVNDNHEVVVIDNQSANNDVFYINSKANYFNCDINDYDQVFELTKGVECIFHLAAESKIGVCIENPTLATKTNVLGTCNLLQAAKLNGVNKFIYSSTSAAYGNKNSPQIETMDVDCLNPYSVTKVAGEDLCKMYYNGEITEDDLRGSIKKLQDKVDAINVSIDDLSKKKEQDIMTV